MATAAKTRTTPPATSPDEPHEAQLVVYLDAELVVRDACNARETDTAADQTLINSVKTLGIQDPISVRPLPDGTYGAFKGWRRAQAQQAANATAAQDGHPVRKVPAYVRSDLVGRDGYTRLLSLIENDHREGMAERDKVKSVELALVEMSEVEQHQAVRALGLRRGAISHARTAQRLDDAALRRASAGGMDLEQTAQLAEVAEVAGAERRLLNALRQDHEQGEGGRARWDQEVALLRAERDDRVAREQAVAALKDADIRLLPASVGYGVKDTSRPLSELTTPLGNPLTEANHSGCPDHSARLDETHQPVWHCADPAAHGHKIRPEAKKAKNPLSPDEAARRSSNIACTRAWKAAREPRHAFLTKLCRTKTLPEAARSFALTHFVVRCADKRDPEILARILGVKPAAGSQSAVLAVPKARDSHLVFANVAAAFEYDLREDKAWTHLGSEAAAWLLLLEELGREANAYALSEVEEQAVARHRPASDRSA